jgi:hypothetical protein
MSREVLIGYKNYDDISKSVGSTASCQNCLPGKGSGRTNLRLNI